MCLVPQCQSAAAHHNQRRRRHLGHGRELRYSAYAAEARLFRRDEGVGRGAAEGSEDFSAKTSKARTKVEDGHLTQLLHVMAALADSFTNAERFELQIKQLRVLSYLETSGGVNAAGEKKRLEEVSTLFGAMMKKSPKIKSGIRLMQEKQGRKIKEDGQVCR